MEFIAWLLKDLKKIPKSLQYKNKATTNNGPNTLKQLWSDPKSSKGS